jgi:kynureninase
VTSSSSSPDRFAFRDDAARFELGTPALPTVYTALGGLEIILEVGMQRIRERNAALTEDLISRLRSDAAPLRLADDPSLQVGDRHGALGDAKQLWSSWRSCGIIVDSRGEWVRISPHFYNTVAENERVVEALEGVGR